MAIIPTSWAAESRGRIGERYILGNHNVSFGEFVGLVCDVAGMRAPTLPIPSSLGQAFALGFELWSDHVSHKPPRATLKSVQYLQRRVFVDGSKARKELSMPCTPLRESIDRAVTYFRQTGAV